MQISDGLLGALFNNFDMPIRFMYSRAGVISRLIHKLTFWLTHSSNSEYICNEYDKMLKILGDYNVSFENKVILELGPGNSMANAMRILLNNPKKIFQLDKYPRIIDTKRQKDFLANEIELVKRINSLSELPFIKEGTINIPELEYHAVDIKDFQPEEEIDFSFSFSVMEHINDLDDALRHLSRITSKGGYSFHIIDMRDHYNFSRPYLFYKYSSKAWERLLTKEGLSFWSRRRYNDYYEAFIKNGFEEVFVSHVKIPCNEKKIDDEFKGRNDLDIAMAYVLFRKKS